MGDEPIWMAVLSTMPLSPEQRTLLAAVVERHGPDLFDTLQALDRRKLTDDEREDLREAVLEELMAEGLDASDEPNRYGLELESLIDALGKS